MDGRHVFSIWWKPDEYVFHVDGKETWRTDAGGVCQVICSAKPRSRTLTIGNRQGL